MLEAQLKDGRTVKFRFKGPVEEAELLNRFTLGSLSQKAKLNLGEHGTVLIGHIIDMWKVVPTKTEDTTKKNVVNLYEHCTFMGDDLIDKLMRGQWTPPTKH